MSGFVEIYTRNQFKELGYSNIVHDKEVFAC